MSVQSLFANTHRQVVAAMLSVAAAAIVVVSLNGSSASAASAAEFDLKGVICHATGSTGNPYVGVIVGIQDESGPIFSNNGHLDFNGSTLSGHEHDIYIGPSPPMEKRDCDKLPPPK
jgi:hypothetical protein